MRYIDPTTRPAGTRGKPSAKPERENPKADKASKGGE
jgi:hypothetical protein